MEKAFPLFGLLVMSLPSCFSPEVLDSADAGSSSAGSSGPGEAGDGASTGDVDVSTSAGTTELASSTGEHDDGSSGSVAGCGDGVVAPPEECDDGNEVVGDGCNPDCRLSGKELWRTTVHGTEEGAVSMSLRDDDHILAVGKVGPTEAAFSNWWRIYSPEGEAVATGDLPGDFLSLRFSGGASKKQGRMVGVEATGDGDLYSGYPLAVGAYNTDFGPAWTAALQDLGGTLPFDEGFAVAAGLGEDGALVVGGAHRAGPSFLYHRGVVRRFGASGSEEWSDVLPDNEYELGGSYCFPASSGTEAGFAVLCYDEPNDSGSFSMRKFSNAGILQFERELEVPTVLLSGSNGSGPDPAWPATPALSVGADGAVAVGVPFGDGRGADGSEVFVYDGSGALVWSDTILGAGGLWLRDAAFLPDRSTVFVGDVASEDGTDGQDAVIARFGPSGESLWTDLHNGSGDGDDRYVDVEVDSEGNLVVFGEEVHIITGRDLLIRKLLP